VNALLMQFQADILNVTVVRPNSAEATALGAAYAAGLAVGYWPSTEDLLRNWTVQHTWKPRMREEQRATLIASWHKAVTRTFDWA
jgi:glycerol kinase